MRTFRTGNDSIHCWIETRIPPTAIRPETCSPSLHRLGHSARQPSNRLRAHLDGDVTSRAESLPQLRRLQSEYDWARPTGGLLHQVLHPAEQRGRSSFGSMYFADAESGPQSGPPEFRLDAYQAHHSRQI